MSVEEDPNMPVEDTAAGPSDIHGAADDDEYMQDTQEPIDDQDQQYHEVVEVEDGEEAVYNEEGNVDGEYLNGDGDGTGEDGQEHAAEGTQVEDQEEAVHDEYGGDTQADENNDVEGNEEAVVADNIEYGDAIVDGNVDDNDNDEYANNNSNIDDDDDGVEEEDVRPYDENEDAVGFDSGDNNDDNNNNNNNNNSKGSTPEPRNEGSRPGSADNNKRYNGGGKGERRESVISLSRSDGNNEDIDDGGKVDFHFGEDEEARRAMEGGLGVDTDGVKAFEGREAMFRLPLRVWVVPGTVIPLSLILTLFTLYSIDVGIVKANSFRNFGKVFVDPSLEQAKSSLDDLGKLMSTYTSLVLTISSIVLQLASNRFTPHITSLFFRDSVVMSVICYMVITNTYVVWVNYMGGHNFEPKLTAFGALLMVTGSLLCLFPYFTYLFDFLDPHKFVRQITSEGVSEISTVVRGSGHADAVREGKKRTVESIERLTDIASNALMQKDTNIATDVLDALQVFCVHYGNMKNDLPDCWYSLGDWIRQTPDYISLSQEAVSDIEVRKCWLEWKVLRRAQALFAESMRGNKDLCYVVAINTRRLGQAAAKRADFFVVDLSIKFFNTYLRASMNEKDIRTAYNVLHQYRQLGEAIMRVLKYEPFSDAEDTAKLIDRVGRIGRFFRYYALQCGETEHLLFMSDIMAYDLGEMTEHAFFIESDCHEDLLHVFLTFNDLQDGTSLEASRAMRFAQIKLGTTYLVAGRGDLAAEVAEEMADEKPRDLLSLWNELKNVDQREFWEVNDRGTNFNYLTHSQKIQLPVYFCLFEPLHEIAKGQIRVSNPAIEKVHPQREKRSRPRGVRVTGPPSGVGEKKGDGDSGKNDNEGGGGGGNNDGGGGTGRSGDGGDGDGRRRRKKRSTKSRDSDSDSSSSSLSSSELRREMRRRARRKAKKMAIASHGSSASLIQNSGGAGGGDEYLDPHYAQPHHGYHQHQQHLHHGYHQPHGQNQHLHQQHHYHQQPQQQAFQQQAFQQQRAGRPTSAMSSRGGGGERPLSAHSYGRSGSRPGYGDTGSEGDGEYYDGARSPILHSGPPSRSGSTRALIGPGSQGGPHGQGQQGMPPGQIPSLISNKPRSQPRADASLQSSNSSSKSGGGGNGSAPAVPPKSRTAAASQRSRSYTTTGIMQHSRAGVVLGGKAAPPRIRVSSDVVVDEDEY